MQSFTARMPLLTATSKFDYAEDAEILLNLHCLCTFQSTGYMLENFLGGQNTLATHPML